MTRTTPASGRRNGTRSVFKKHGIEVFRVKFPHGMDANEYACKVKPADKSLALLMNAAQWAGNAEPSHPVAPEPPLLPEAASVPVNAAPAPSLSLAASVSGSEEGAAKKEKQLAPPANAVPAVVSIITPPCLQQRGDAWFLDLEGREYRVAGLEKTVGTDALKIALRLRARRTRSISTKLICAGTWNAAGSWNAPPRKPDSPPIC